MKFCWEDSKFWQQLQRVKAVYVEQPSCFWCDFKITLNVLIFFDNLSEKNYLKNSLQVSWEPCDRKTSEISRTHPQSRCLLLHGFQSMPPNKKAVSLITARPCCKWFYHHENVSSETITTHLRLVERAEKTLQEASFIHEHDKANLKIFTQWHVAPSLTGWKN